MAAVYRINPDGTSTPMKRIHCVNEDRDLQRILEQNLDLLPGEQIAPEDPRRWLLVKREMPVPDPASGQDRWSIDFVLLDQGAIPTFVECKRFADTRSRREVVAQMLEYAANGHYYWTAEHLQGMAARTTAARGLTLEEAVQGLSPDDDLGPDDFFERAEVNLREGQIRLVFFLEEAPFELKSIVDFLNRQMQRTEVLLVEARQYELDGTRIVVPSLFGYTEEARRVKRTFVVQAAGGARQRWDEARFFEAAAAGGDENVLEALRAAYDYARARGWEIAWGTGAVRGSFGIKVPGICPRSIFTFWADGAIAVNFGYLNRSETAELFRDALQEALVTELGWSFPSDYAQRFVTIPSSGWTPRSRKLLDLLETLVARFGVDV
ncbi:MAG: hypothetical protein Kow00109_24550 [Acidobacteriota bacterium]